MINTKEDRVLTREETLAFLELFPYNEKVTNSKLIEYFGKKPIFDENNKFVGSKNPVYFTNDTITLEAGTIPSIKKQVTTSTGVYIFNIHCLYKTCGDQVEYYNDILNGKSISKLIGIFMEKIRNNEMDITCYHRFLEEVQWLSYRSELFLPNVTKEFLVPDKKVIRERERLIKEKKDIIENQDVVRFINEIETPLLKMAADNLKDNPAWPLYARGGKPKFGNTHKMNVITVGPIFDPLTGKHRLVLGALSDTITPEDYDIYGNMQRAAAYARGVATQDGGASVKFIFDAMQTVKLQDKGSDCKSDRCLEMILTEKDVEDFINSGRYIMEKDVPVLLTKDNINQYIGKKIKLRTPLFCKGLNYCNVCSGDHHYEMDIVNVGLILARISASVMKLALKAMHDVSVNTTSVDPRKYFEQIT